MADPIKNFTFLDQAGVSTLTTALLKQVNVKINDRAVDALSASSDAYHFLTAAALYGLLGATDADGTGTTINDKIAALKTLVGQNATAVAGDGSVFGAIKQLIADIGDADTATGTGETVYDAIKTLDTKVDGLTHLTIETYVGDVADIQDPKTDKLYFVKSTEDDPTWELYVATKNSDTVTWINVGDTSVDLANYFKHGDLTAMGDDAIKDAVAAAYAASADPTVVA